MPRAAIAAIALLALVASGATAGGPSGVHLDPTTAPAGCQGCHSGHGAPGSAMLPARQADVCLTCHGKQAGEGRLPPGVHASRLPSDPAFAHPMSGDGSMGDDGGVACTSCHSPHRDMAERSRGGAPRGRKKLSPRSPRELEHELCGSCHGRTAPARGREDLSRLLSPGNRSFHPVEAPSMNRAPSTKESLAGREINCTDCHGNDDSAAPGMHGSSVRFILAAGYATSDGESESKGTYALCYGCHDRESVLRGGPFPGHKKHIVDNQASCATCHDPHGSVSSRALIRFGENRVGVGMVAPSQKAGRLAFISDSPGSGTCYLTCHGYDHAPASYGIATAASMRRDPASTIRPALPSGPGRGSQPGLPAEPRAPRVLDPIAPGDRP